MTLTSPPAGWCDRCGTPPRPPTEIPTCARCSRRERSCLCGPPFMVCRSGNTMATYHLCSNCAGLPMPSMVGG